MLAPLRLVRVICACHAARAIELRRLAGGRNSIAFDPAKRRRRRRRRRQVRRGQAQAQAARRWKRRRRKPGARTSPSHCLAAGCTTPRHPNSGCPVLAWRGCCTAGVSDGSATPRMHPHMGASQSGEPIAGWPTPDSSCGAGNLREKKREKKYSPKNNTGQAGVTTHTRTRTLRAECGVGGKQPAPSVIVTGTVQGGVRAWVEVVMMMVVQQRQRMTGAAQSRDSPP